MTAPQQAEPVLSALIMTASYENTPFAEVSNGVAEISPGLPDFERATPGKQSNEPSLSRAARRLSRHSF